MSKKKHPEHVNHERWLVSYADFITLLFAFFVVLFASSQSDKRKQVKLARAMQTAFEHAGIFDEHSKTPPMTDDAAGTTATDTKPLTLPLPTALAEQTEQRIEQVIRQQVAAERLGAGVVSVNTSPDGLVVSLREAGFFASGSAAVRPEALGVLNALADALPHGFMRVEGHTDNVPIHTAQFATNWELSTARAASITRLLIDRRAADPAQISASGFAEFHPKANNGTEAGRAENRRVDIVLLRPSATPPEPAAAKVKAKPEPAKPVTEAATSSPPQAPSR